MNTMWKFPLQLINGRQSVAMPAGAVALHAAMQDGKPCMWALVDSLNPQEERFFEVFGTGHEIPEDAINIGICMDRCFVWHIFEVPTATVSDVGSHG